jgi:hypothetical protein
MQVMFFNPATAKLPASMLEDIRGGVGQRLASAVRDLQDSSGHLSQFPLASIWKTWLHMPQSLRLTRVAESAKEIFQKAGGNE